MKEICQQRLYWFNDEAVITRLWSLNMRSNDYSIRFIHSNHFHSLWWQELWQSFIFNLIPAQSMPHWLNCIKFLVLRFHMGITPSFQKIAACTHKSTFLFFKWVIFHRWKRTYPLYVIYLWKVKAICMRWVIQLLTYIVYCLGMDFGTLTYPPLEIIFFFIMHFVDVSYKPY